MEGRHLPAELLKIRLNQQLGRLKELLNNHSSSEGGCKTWRQEDPFCLYQRIVSWFVMGRLSKHEYDKVLETLLETSELIELHNRVLELLRAIHCGSSGLEGGPIESFSCPTLPAFAFNLLSSTERNLLSSLLPSPAQEEQFKASLSLQTAIKLTQSEEVLISEAMRMPVLSLSFPSPPTYSDYFGAEGPTDRLTVELGRLLDGTEMRTRIATIAEGAGLEFDGEASDDGVSVLLCKVVEDFVKNLIQNAWELKYNQEAALQPPESFIFGFAEDGDQERSDLLKQSALLSERDIQVLLKLKPWLLADFLPELGE